MKQHNFISDTDGNIWELIDTEAHFKHEFEEMVGVADFSDSEIHFVMFAPASYYSSEDEFMNYVPGTSPEELFLEGH